MSDGAAVRLILLLAALLTAGPAIAANQPLRNLTPIGTPQADDLIPIARGTLDLQSVKVSDLTAAAATEPGGLNTQVQYNNSTAFAGITGAYTTDGVVLTLVAPLLVDPLGSTPSSSTYWRGDGTWAAVTGATGGTVTSITAGTGLTGGAITSTGTIALDVPVTVAHGGTNCTSASLTCLSNIIAATGSPSSTTFLRGDNTWGTPAGTGVTSVVASTGLSGGTITSTGTIAVTANVRTRGFGTSFGDTGGSALSSGSVAYFTVPFACTISAWNMTLDAGTATIDIWKIATGTAIPTVSNTITASALPAIATGTALHSTTLTGWTTSVTANDIFGFQLKTVSTAKYVSVTLECDQ